MGEKQTGQKKSENQTEKAKLDVRLVTRTRACRCWWSGPGRSLRRPGRRRERRERCVFHKNTHKRTELGQRASTPDLRDLRLRTKPTGGHRWARQKPATALTSRRRGCWR